jgi:hypothetical protein
MLFGAGLLAWFVGMDWDTQARSPNRGMYWDIDQEKERNRREELDNMRQEIDGREERRKQLAHDVIDQRVTLRQAADFLRDMETRGLSLRYYMEHLWAHYPGKTTEEALCAKVISLVKTELEGEPERCRQVLARLEEELQKGPEPSGSPSPPPIPTPIAVHE